jgi:hypothetical protein
MRIDDRFTHACRTLSAVLVVCLAASCATTRPPAPGPIDIARDQFAKGDIEPGLKTLEEGLRKEPESLEMGNFYRARIVENKQEDRSINFFKQLTEGGGSPNEAYYNFAFAYIDKIPRVGPMGAGFLSKRSIAQFKIVLDKDQNDWIANYGIGMNYLHWPDYFKKTEGALGYFEACMRLQAGKPVKPAYLLTYLRMGDALIRGGEIDRAYRVWDEGAKSFPRHRDLQARLDTPRDRIETVIRNLYNPNNSIGAIDTNIEILWASAIPEKAVPLERNTLQQAGVGGQLRSASSAPEASQLNLFSWFTRNLPNLSDRNAISKVDMSSLGVKQGSRLESRVSAIAYGMITGFMAELEGESDAALRSRANSVDSFTRPFFHEGLGMGYAAAVSIESSGELKTMAAAMNKIDPNFQRLHLAGAGMWFGLEGTKEPDRVAEAFSQLGPFGEAYAYEGYGFARTLFYFKSNTQVTDTGTLLRPEAAANFYHGVGRAFWILSGADAGVAEQTLETVPVKYRNHAYSGYAMGLAFTQVDDLKAVFSRIDVAGKKPHQAQLLTGITMGLYIRRLGDPAYVDSLLKQAVSVDQCRARQLLAVGEAALKETGRGASDLHANWRAAIQARIEDAGARSSFTNCV